MRTLPVIIKGRKAHDQAIQSFQTALKYAPNNATLHYNIGLSYQILGEIGPAIRSYQETPQPICQSTWVLFNRCMGILRGFRKLS